MATYDRVGRPPRSAVGRARTVGRRLSRGEPERLSDRVRDGRAVPDRPGRPSASRRRPPAPAEPDGRLTFARCACAWWSRCCWSSSPWAPSTTCGPYPRFRRPTLDRKSTRLNSSHANISYAVFCLKKKKKKIYKVVLDKTTYT